MPRERHPEQTPPAEEPTETEPTEAEPTEAEPTEEPTAGQSPDTEEPAADEPEGDEIQRLGATGKARAYLLALRDSESRASYTPTDQTLVVNGVEVFVPAGAITAKPAGELPQPLAMGCDLLLEAFGLEPDAPVPDEARPRGHVRLAVAP